MKRFLFLLPFLIMLSFLLLFPDTSFTCAASGLMLWFETLLPSLLPFMIISNLLIRTDLLKKMDPHTSGPVAPFFFSYL